MNIYQPIKTGLSKWFRSTKITKILHGYTSPWVEGDKRINPDLNLLGDRGLEWSWIIANLPANHGRLVDIGCVESIIPMVAVRNGYEIFGIDLRDINYTVNGFTFIKGDATKLELQSKFDAVILCSTIEHVGLGGRYDSPNDSEADLTLLKKIKTWLNPGGIVLLTLPVGIDDVFSPYHRVYGSNRFGALIEGYNFVKEEYWKKSSQNNWYITKKEEAFSTQGYSNYYALGLFVLSPA